MFAAPLGQVHSHNATVVSAIYHTELRQVVSVDEAGTVKVWDVDTGIMLFSFRVDHGSRLTSIGYDEAKLRLITAADNGTISVWNPNAGQILARFKNQGHGLEQTAVVHWPEVSRRSAARAKESAPIVQSSAALAKESAMHDVACRMRPSMHRASCKSPSFSPTHLATHGFGRDPPAPPMHAII